MKELIVIFFVTVCANFVKSQDLLIPIEGTYGIDYIIVNYPDWHLVDGTVLVEDGFLNDHMCGTKTYDGHQGTDFVIRGFTQMDSSVNVLTVADGEIIHVTEDLFDRETDGIEAYGLGNYIGIYHAATNTYSYYAHLKTNSVIHEIGDMVSAGDVIAEVGSSGNSTDPHLHFELWNPGAITDPTIDPWGEPCGLGINLWESSPAYDTSYAVWECGLVNYDTVGNFLPASWYPLKERLDQKTGFTTDDPFFTFWALQYGLKIGDETKIEWYDPNGDLYASNTTAYTTQNWWFHYYNHSIPTPPASKQGIWTIRYYYNDSLQVTKSFPYGHLTNFENQLNRQTPYYYKPDKNTLVLILPDKSVYTNASLYKLTGEMVMQKELSGDQQVEFILPSELGRGIYIMSLYNTDERYVFKVFLD